jgi:hypothetical protein
VLELALLAMLAPLVGCVDPPAADDRAVVLSQLRSGTGRVAADEEQCSNKAVERSDAGIAQVVSTPDASIDERMELVVEQRNKELAQCESDADQQNEKLSEGERADYEREAQEPAQPTVMQILVTSGP